MTDCLGISALGTCAYDPTNPPSIYFSIGEAVAALSITLIIPQFLRPIYRFRLATRSIRLPQLYLLVFLGAACVLAASLIPNLGFSSGQILTFPIFWEFLGGCLFFGAFGALVFAVVRPATTRRGAYPRFAQAAADFLAHASTQDQSDFSRDLLRNIEKLICTTRIIQPRRERSAFFEFQYRREIEDAQYASTLLKLFAEPQLCQTLVHRCPWDTAAILQLISDSRLASYAAEGLVRELGRQAIICPSSMIAREIGYKGFHAAPVLSEALFGDWFVNKRYQPLSGIELRDIKNADHNVIDRMSHAYRLTLATVLDAGAYWEAHCLVSLPENMYWVTEYAHRRIRVDSDKYEAVASIKFGLNRLIRDSREHLESLDARDYEMIYADSNQERDFTVMDYLSEAVVDTLSAFANDFEGLDDAFWLTAQGTISDVFPRYPLQPDGMDPLQQRVALKLIAKVRENMEGYYPALTRVLLSVLGPYEEPPNENRNSPYSLLRRAFYAELRQFPELYAQDPEKARHYLPNDVRYDAANGVLTKFYRLGREGHTDLRSLDIQPVRFEAVRRVSRGD